MGEKSKEELRKDIDDDSILSDVMYPSVMRILGYNYKVEPNLGCDGNSMATTTKQKNQALSTEEKCNAKMKHGVAAVMYSSVKDILGYDSRSTVMANNVTYSSVYQKKVNDK